MSEWNRFTRGDQNELSARGGQTANDAARCLVPDQNSCDANFGNARNPYFFGLNLHQPILPSESSTRQRQSNECDFRAIASRLHGTVCMPTILDLRTREAIVGEPIRRRCVPVAAFWTQQARRTRHRGRGGWFRASI